MIEDDKRNLANRLEEKSIELARVSNNAARHPKPDDECTLWVECQGHWDLHTEDVEWTTKKWLEKREGDCREIQKV